jgi:FtsP/CotA-like multicopper oxidase with cupredoxin domain
MKVCCGARRDVFLKIEPVTGYSPLAPEPCGRRWGRDAMFNQGHELGRVQSGEIIATTFDALVYHEYFDTHYTHANTAKLVEADINEPAWNRRVPGCVLYARPGERLYIHVLNGDPSNCHSFHLHGLRYGIDSDGAWPFGVRTQSGRRSDEIRPGETWTYVFDATEETIGAWPFHDHVRSVQANVNRGLFGALIVRDPRTPRADHEIPLFVHQLQGFAQSETFQSPTLGHGGTYTQPFTTAGTVAYHCKIHGTSMAGTIVIDPTAPAGNRTVTIGDNFFNPASASIRPGASVTWINNGNFDHIIFAPGGGAATFCLNGRAYVGNTPTIEAAPGERLRWYLCNLDLGTVWHNVHPHSARWQLPTPTGGATDVHALSPAQAFVMDTEVPPALRLPCALEPLQCDPPESACRVPVKGEFLFHCHLEEHMMSGLAGLVRSRDSIWVTTEALKTVDVLLPYDDGRNEIGWVDLTRCGHTCPTGKHPHTPEHPTRESAHEPTHNQPHVHEHAHAHDEAVAGADEHLAPAVPSSPIRSMTTMRGMSMPGMPDPLDICAAEREGVWELLPCDSKVLAVHAVLMHSGRVLFFAGSGNNVPRFNAHDSRSVVWDYQAGTFHTPVTPFDVFCAGQTVLPDGKVLVAGGTQQYDPFIGLKSSWLFDPMLEEWIRIGDMAFGRWYPSLVTLGDGRAIAVSGISQASEIYSPFSGWSTLPHGTDLPLYPHLLVLADAKVFFTGGQLGQAMIDARKIDPITAAETIVPGLRSQGNRDEAFSILLPPAQDQKVMVFGGGGPAHATNHTDIVDLKAVAPHYVVGPDMAHARGLHSCVILPDRTVLVSGGGYRGETRADAVHAAELYNPATNKFQSAGTQLVARLYHSIALLLPDGRVITAGSNPDRSDDELRLELYHPPYLFRGPRPFIQATPHEWVYGTEVAIHTPQASDIKWAHLIRPMAVTHSDDTSQRLVDLPIRSRDACHLHVSVTANPNLAPPGWYLLFLCDKSGVPSVAEWIHLDRMGVVRPVRLNEKIRRTHKMHAHDHRPGFPIPGFPIKGRD